MASGTDVTRAGAGHAGNKGGGKAASTLPEKVAQLYYALGLFCSTYPTTIITIAIAVVLFCCYPLVNLPLPGNLPLQVFGPNLTVAGSTVGGLTGEPLCYVQQIVLKTAVVPWAPGLLLADAFRAPLYEVFKLLEVVQNYQHDTSSRTLAHLCLHVESVKRAEHIQTEPVLPEYNCLVLSPANFWQQNVQQFNQDSHLLTTIFNHQNIQKGKTSLAEILFGMNMKETGIKRYPLRIRQRILQYAITMVFKQYDEEYITGLKHKLASLYPLHQTNRSAEDNSTAGPSVDEDIMYIYYPGVINYVELVPLSLAFLILFFYIYFSVRKIELIKSKIGMAFAAVVTVLGSLFMSVGLCFFFGLTLSMQQGKEIFPYLVILVGLENVLVLTKSVVSTPQHLDVKIRVAQGLSKEGWSITKNILVEITILTIGLATFVPVIQEFCIFAITGLISDFFLQMFFFSTILGIDIHRMEISAEMSHTSFRNTLYQTPHKVVPRPGGMNRSKSHPRLTTISSNSSSSNSQHTNVVAGQVPAQTERRIPKRVRLVNIWARTRFFQRAFMIWMVVWISMIVYNSGVVEHFLEVDTSKAATTTREPLQSNFTGRRWSSMNHTSSSVQHSVNSILSGGGLLDVNYVTETIPVSANTTDELARLRHAEYVTRLRLSSHHWPAIFDRYNLSLSGSYIAVLPRIRLSHAVSPEQAVLLRNGNEKHVQSFQWQALAAALDPIDFNDNSDKHSADYMSQVDQPYYPNSPMEILLATILCVISVVVLAYMMVVLYRCVCTRNYAEWRASWSNEKSDEPVAQFVMEAVPVVLDGHCQEVECMVTDGSSIVSSCLGGQLKIWDATTGEQMANIDRKLYFNTTTTTASGVNKSPDLSLDYDDSMLSDYESGSPPSRDEHSMSFPSLQKKINTNFSQLKLEQLDSNEHRRRNGKFNFGDQYRQLYLNHEREPEQHRSRHSSTTHGDTAKWIINQASVNLLNGSNSAVQCEQQAQCTGVPPIWCIDYTDNLIVLGCASGRLEFWEGTTGKLKCVFEDGSGIGVTSIKLVGSKVVVAKLNGVLDFLQLQSYSQGRQIDWGFTSAYRRTHVRTGSTGSIIDNRDYTTYEDNFEDLRCIRLNTTKAHQQPITAIDSEGGRVLSGSQDHTLKVYRLEDASPLYTLHGHCGPITCLFIDRVSPMMSGSGSQDGLLCVWDLLTGACMYSIQAHDGSITSLTYSASYVISLGADDKLCVWERFQGHLLNTINVSHTYASGVLMLTHNLLVTARQGSLMLLDVRTGDTVRSVTLGHHDNCVFVKQMLLLRDAIVCDYGTQLRIVRFPLITHKFD
ncbi:SREBP cleavage activating protein [Carabus blaptoides fortunei]